MAADGLCSRGRLEPDTNPLGLCSAGAHAHKGCVTVPGVCADGGSLKRGLTSLRVPSSSSLLPPPPPALRLLFPLFSFSFFPRVFPSAAVLVGLTRVTRRSHDGCDSNTGDIEPLTSCNAEAASDSRLAADNYTSWLEIKK